MSEGVIPLRIPVAEAAGPAPLLPPVSLRAFALAALSARAGGPDDEPETAFLRAHLHAVAPPGQPWAEDLARYVLAPAPSDLPLIALGDALALEPVEMLAIALAAAVEDDAMAGRAIAWMQRPLGGSRPTLSLLATCLADACAPGTRPIDALSAGRAVRSGALEVRDPAVPLPERSISVPLHVCQALAGGDGAVPGVSLGSGPISIPLPPSLEHAAARHAAGLRGEFGRVLIIRTGSPDEGRAAAEEVAMALGRRAAFIDGEMPAGLGPWLLLRGMIPVFVHELAPGERKTLPSIPGWNGPSMALCGPDGSFDAAAGTPLSWTLPVPAHDERRLLWEEALGDPALAMELAALHRHGSGRIANLGRLARHRGAVEGRRQATLHDVITASRLGDGTGLDALAQPIPTEVPDGALVAGSALQAELEMLLLRCRMRDGLADGLGTSASVRYTPGVRALFVGPSGTGKTLAAAWLATRLGLPLYRVDLASVTSKYIGETEKNLARLLSRAEQAEVVLLFDEADSLFGKRTDVRDANDRFANAQTNYLLQRIEGYTGITVLTSNSRARFDPAFARRLDMIVDFPMPGPEERRALWVAHLGGGHALAEHDLNRLAAVADVGGGNIRNAVLDAAVRARGAGRTIVWDDVEAALAGEYRKLGKTLPAGLRAAGAPSTAGNPWPAS